MGHKKRNAPFDAVEMVRRLHEGASTLVRMVRVDGLGHAWSGGDAAFPYNDPGPPDATALLGVFVAELIR